MPKPCCVPGCADRGDRATRLPVKNKPLLKIWLDNIKNETLFTKSDQQLQRCMVCSSHFEKRYLIKSNYPGSCNKTIKKGAVPTLNLPKGMSTGSELKSVPSTSSVNINLSISTDMPMELESNLMPSTSSTEFETPLISLIESKNIEEDFLRSTRKFEKLYHFTTNMNKTINECFVDFISDETRNFLKIQVRTKNQRRKDYEFTLREKILCLNLLKLSTETYKILSKLFFIPARFYLESFLGQIPINMGINNVIISHLKSFVSKLDKIDRYCLLIFDELPLGDDTNYDQKYDKLTGFVSSERDSDSELADRALVFMIRGVYNEWKLPLAYFFCRGPTDKFYLMRCIKETVGAVKTTGLQVVATVCDHGPTNVSANYLLREQTLGYYLSCGREFCSNGFEMYGRMIFQIYDPPNLMKGLRNDLLTKNITFKIDKETVQYFPEHIRRYISFENEDEKTFIASWVDIQNFYFYDLKRYRMGFNLTDDHVIPDRIKKNVVKYATQVLSLSVGRGIIVTAEDTTNYNQHKVGRQALGTALICLFFDTLFDSVNGVRRSPPECKPLKTAISHRTKHPFYWNLAIKILRTMSFSSDSQIPPSVTYWIYTLQSIKELWDYLKGEEFFYLNLRQLNQDPLDNFISQIRGHETCNSKISCLSFQSSFKTIFLNLLSRIPADDNLHTNCEDDLSYPLGELETFMKISSELDNKS